MYRWWTGTSWTTAITASPQTTPPPVTAGGVGQVDYGSGGYPYAPTRRKGVLGWWLGGAAALVAVVVAIMLVVQQFGGGTGPLLPDIGNNEPTSSVTPNICPPASTSDPAPPTSNAPSGWVASGNLGFPELGAPWENTLDNRVPWGSLSRVQEVVDQANYDGSGSNWVASILVSDLFVGDGFASTKVAAETVLKCVLGTYYADTVVTTSQVSSAQHDVDGHPGWLIETQLSFDIPQLNAKGERVLLLVVQTSDDDYGLFYASVPDTRSELVPDARKALAGLRVFS